MSRKQSIFGRIKNRLTGHSNTHHKDSSPSPVAAVEEEEDENEDLDRSNGHVPSGLFDMEESSYQELIKTELAHELSVAFDLYSKGMSSIPCKEVGYVLRSLGQNPTEDDIINLVYESGCHWEGYLTKDDFMGVGIIAMHKQANRLDDVKAAFRAFDHNNDGAISMEELRDAMTRYGHTFSPAECEEMFMEADKNGDGQIDFDEFVSIMMADHQLVDYATQQN